MLFLCLAVWVCFVGASFSGMFVLRFCVLSFFHSGCLAFAMGIGFYCFVLYFLVPEPQLSRTKKAKLQ